MSHVRGIKGEAVVIYCDPLITKDMGYNRLSQRINNIEIKYKVHISLNVHMLKCNRIIGVRIKSKNYDGSRNCLCSIKVEVYPGTSTGAALPPM